MNASTQSRFYRWLIPIYLADNRGMCDIRWRNCSYKFWFKSIGEMSSIALIFLAFVNEIRGRVLDLDSYMGYGCLIMKAINSGSWGYLYWGHADKSSYKLAFGSKSMQFSRFRTSFCYWISYSLGGGMFSCSLADGILLVIWRLLAGGSKTFLLFQPCF